MFRFMETLQKRLTARFPALQPGHPSYPWWVMGAIAFATVMSILDTTVVNVAIAKFEVAFGASADAVQWVITGYLLSLAVTLSASGWIADRVGYKTVFLAAVSLFTFGSFLCSLSWNLSSLVIFRVIQGIGGGMMAPVAGAYIRKEFPREKLGLAMGVLIIPTLVVSSFGPTIGGWIIDNFSWQLIFTINVPIGIAGFCAAYVILREHRAQEGRSFDLPGFAAIAVALSALLLALSDGNAAWNTDGWTSTFIVSCFGVSALGFLVFFVAEFSSDHPLVELSLFKNYNYGLGSFVLFIAGLGIFGADFLLPLYLQVGLGYTPMQAGVIFIPYGLGMAATSVIGGRLTDRIGAKIPGVAGIVIRAYGMYRFAFLSPYSSGAEIVLTVLILAVGMGLLASPIQTTIFAAVPVERAAQGSSLMQMVRQLGGSFGVAVLSTVLTRREKFHFVMAGQAMSASSPVFTHVLSLASRHAMQAAGATASSAAAMGQAIIVNAVQTQSFVAAIDDAFFITLVVSLVSSIPFIFLRTPRGRKRARTPAESKRPAHEIQGAQS